MKSALAAGVAGLLCLGIIGCDQRDAPADTIEQTAEEIVDPAAEPTPLATGRFAPHDDCAQVPGAAAFRASLLQAVDARDGNALAALAADDIRLDFGDGGGIAELRERLADPDWGLWGELGEVLRLGCAANEQGGITIPWIADQDLAGRDPFSSMLVTGEAVPVRSAPDPAAVPIRVISWDLVQIESLRPDAAFQQVELPDGRRGFVATTSLRSPVDYRLTASSRNGKWSITSFVAGD